ncbi:MAG: hypothetical protein IT530_02270 [Burkholderiales bacterium]|nr:hypothetical protein [Burkholderiales bacterium]
MNESPLLGRLTYLTARSTAPSTIDADLVEAVRKAEALRDRAQAARDARCQPIYAAIRTEGGMLSTSYTLARRVEVVHRALRGHLEQYALPRVPSRRVIREQLRVMDAAKINSVASSETTTQREQASTI